MSMLPSFVNLSLADIAGKKNKSDFDAPKPPSKKTKATWVDSWQPPSDWAERAAPDEPVLPFKVGERPNAEERQKLQAIFGSDWHCQVTDHEKEGWKRRQLVNERIALVRANSSTSTTPEKIADLDKLKGGESWMPLDWETRETPQKKVQPIQPQPTPDEVERLTQLFGENWHCEIEEFERETWKRQQLKNERILTVRTMLQSAQTSPGDDWSEDEKQVVFNAAKEEALNEWTRHARGQGRLEPSKGGEHVFPDPDNPDKPLQVTIPWAEVRDNHLIHKYGGEAAWRARWPQLSEHEQQSAKDEYRQIRTNELREEQMTFAVGKANAVLEEAMKGEKHADVTVKAAFRKAWRTLLRFYFSRIGIDGTKMHWRVPYPDSPIENKKLVKERTKWAQMTVRSWMETQGLTDLVDAKFRPSEFPIPPSNLYGANDKTLFVVLPLPVVLQNTVNDEGGQWLWSYMKALRTAIKPHKRPENPKILAQGMRYFNESFRTKLIASMKVLFEDFIGSLSDYNSAYDYTGGAGRFNRYLLYSGMEDGKAVAISNPKDIPQKGKTPMNPQYSLELGPGSRVHGLWKLIREAPYIGLYTPTAQTLPERACFLRAVNNKNKLPHVVNGGKGPDDTVEDGFSFVVPTFLSTTVADVKAYFNGGLSTFYGSACCFHVIVCDERVQAIPIVFGNSQYNNEQEIILPAGLVLTYRGQSQWDGEGMPHPVTVYEATLPDVSISKQMDGNM